jgi:hypothetical protein
MRGGTRIKSAPTSDTRARIRTREIWLMRENEAVILIVPELVLIPIQGGGFPTSWKCPTNSSMNGSRSKVRLILSVWQGPWSKMRCDHRKESPPAKWSCSNSSSTVVLTERAFRTDCSNAPGSSSASVSVAYRSLPIFCAPISGAKTRGVGFWAKLGDENIHRAVRRRGVDLESSITRQGYSAGVMEKRRTLSSSSSGDMSLRSLPFDH